MASLCKKQQCTIDRRGFRQELDSWRHKLIHCVGFESILEGLTGPELVKDLKVFKDFEPITVSDWSFDENCLFCCLRRDKVKEHLFGFNKNHLEDAPKPLLVKDQIRIIRLEKKAEEFLNAILCRKGISADVPNFSDPHIPVVAREILQRMISQFAAEYTSKTSSPQDSRSDSPPPSDQSRLAPLLPSGTTSTSPANTLVGAAQNQNPVLSKLLMADQDAPLDLTIKKPTAEPHEQDGVLDLSIKRNRCSSNSSISSRSICLSPATVSLKCESPDYRSSKAKDLQSTSTLEQFMAKLCPHHQRRIVDAIGFLQTEVKAHASSNVQKTSDSTSGVRGKASLNSNSSSTIPEKSHPELKLPNESTPKAEVLEFPNSVPNSDSQKNIPEDAVSLKTSITPGPLLDVFSLGFGSNQPRVSSTPSSVDGENNRQSDQPPVRMKIKTSSAAAGKKLSCVLDNPLSSPFHFLEEKRGSSNRTETHSARLSSSVKRHSQLNVTPQASQKEVLEHQKDKMAKVFPTHVSFPSNSIRTARKTVRVSSEHQVRDNACREIVDPDIGNCDIVFIDKPITDCLKEKRRGMAPRRNARKSTRGHMYSDDIWVLKTVRTLAGRGNCPNPMPEMTTLVTPKQILTKPEGLPPVDMPFAGTFSETVNQQIPSEESNEHVISGAGDVVEVAASKVDSVEVEMSQTDQGQNKVQSGSPPFMNLLVESQETLSDTLTDQETMNDLRMAKEIGESVGPPSYESTTSNEPESQQVVLDNTEQTVTETQVDSLESLTPGEAEHQLSSDKLLSCEDDILNSSVTVNLVEEETKKDKEEKTQEEQSQEIQPQMELHCDNVERTEMSVSTGIAEELTVTRIETEMPETKNCVEPVETTNNEAECNEPAKPVDEQPKELPPWHRKKDTKAQLPDQLRQPEPVIVGFVNGKPVSASDRSLRHRADRNPTPSSKTPIKSCQNLLMCSVSESTPTSAVENKKLEEPQLETNTLETAMIQQVMEPSSDLPSSETSKLPSRTKETPKQKSSPRNQRRLPVPSDQSADQTESTVSKRQLRSDTQNSASISSIITSISSPKPSTLILPPAEQLPSLRIPPFPLPLTIPSLNKHSDPSVSECSQQHKVSETMRPNTKNTQPIKEISEDTQKNKLVSESETKQTLRSGKVVSDNSKNEKHLSTEESNSSENPSPVKTENQTEFVPTSNKRGLRKNSDVGESDLIQKQNVILVEDRLASEDKDVSMSERPRRMPLRSNTEMSDEAVSQSPPPDNKKLVLRSQRSTPHFTSAADTPKQNDVVSPVRIIPERTAKAQLKPTSGTVAPLTHNAQTPVIAPKQEPPKQTVNKFFQALTGEENQHLITNLNTKYDKMLKGWVQMDKEGQPTAKYKNKSDRQAAIWKSKRRARKPKSSEQQKYSPVQMLFMKGFSLTSICRWFLDSTETKSLVIVKKVNTRLPSETQLCFHSSSTGSGSAQDAFPSLQAERLKKHLKKFPIASPVKSNPRSQKLIAKALEQEANTVKRAELPSSTQNLSKYSAAKASAQKGESQKPSGKSKNPASARILRKYSNIRGKMQGQQSTVRMKRGSKMLKNKKSVVVTKSSAKSNLNPRLKMKKSTVPVSKKIKESAAKLARRKILTGSKAAKPSLPKRAVKTQANRVSKDKSKRKLPKRCSQRLGSPKVPEYQPVDTSKSKISSKKIYEVEREVSKKKPQTKESAHSTIVESKGKEIAAETPQQGVDVKASGSSDQVQTRSQRKMEAATPLSGSLGNPSKRAKKTSLVESPKAATELDEPKLTRSGALKRSQASSLPRSGTKVATKRAQELQETPAKRTRTK
ncbi:titin homolog isoform X1 [Xiphophorus maculatus]|uniref:titin homolog isoform X1 n=1 Tax=Xiphophorus maculatus TaxID=8083 RepID=UPI000C6C9D05|nr:titin homolog isoform X1 [Xiphophorus maculatus]